MGNIMQTCYQCKQNKEDKDFYKNKSKPSGLGSECKECSKNLRKLKRILNPEINKQNCYNYYTKNKISINNKRKILRKENPDLERNSNLKNKYNLTLEQKQKMLQEQKFLCAISGCKKEIDISGHVDHCHNTGKIRALLCSNCNTSLGLLKENFDRILGLANYIQEHNNVI